jgi:hypothetical protein
MDSRCSRIRAEFHLEPLPVLPIGEASAHNT